ncbi:unnamed protein product, partial [Didymodactylos carnosus]
MADRKQGQQETFLQDLLPQVAEVKYVKGKKNTGPDLLSRQATLNAMVTRTKTRQTTAIPARVNKDEATRAPPTVVYDIDLAKIKDEQVMNNFVLANDVLYRVVTRKRGGGKKQVPYLPASLIPTVLSAYHDHPLAGHFGVGRTYFKVKAQFWWSRMRKTIEQYVASCDKCAQCNILRSKAPGHLTPIEPPDEVFQVLHMDFWGPTDPSEDGNRYVLVITDNLS